MSQFISVEKCETVQIEQLSEEWFALRFGFITMSALGSIFIFAKTEGDRQRRARILCGTEKETFTPEVMEIMKYGTMMENEIRSDYSKKVGIPIHEVGICISKINPLFRGSPDGVLENGDLIEIKTTGKPTPTTYNEDFSEIPIWHMWQMQGNMFITGAPRCHYVCYSKTDKQTYIRVVNFNPEIWNPIMTRSMRYYNEYMAPILNPPTDDGFVKVRKHSRRKN